MSQLFDPGMLEFLQDNDALLWWLGIGSVLTFVGSIILVPILIVGIPADYLLEADQRRARRKELHPVLRMVGIVMKNALGLVLIVAGLAMLALPGQGLITLLLGLGLLNFPGKRRLLRKILGNKRIHGAINRMREKRGKPPLQVEA